MKTESLIGQRWLNHVRNVFITFFLAALAISSAAVADKALILASSVSGGASSLTLGTSSWTDGQFLATGVYRGPAGCGSSAGSATLIMTWRLHSPGG